jgi:hypothetical protein
MKNATTFPSLVLGILLLAGFAAHAQTLVSPAGRAPTPEFSVSPASIGFGDVNTGTMKQDSVVVTNTDTVLVSIAIACYNKLFTTSSTSFSLIPAGSKKVYVRFAPRNAGLKTARLVFTNRLGKQVDTVTLEGSGVGVTIEPIFSVTPAMLDFGDDTTGKAKLDSVFVTNTGNETLEISNVVSRNGVFIIWPRYAAIPPAGAQKFEVYFYPMSPGPDSGRIVFEHNAANLRDSILCRGNGIGLTFKPIFSASVDSLDFDGIRLGASKSRTIIVTNLGNKSLSVAASSSSDPPFSIAPANRAIAPGTSWNFEVTYTPDDSIRQDGFIIFRHNAGAVSDSIQMTGVGVGPEIKPVFSVTPPTVNFGAVYNRTTKIDSVRVINAGEAQLRISSVKSDTNRYTITPSSATIAPSASKTYFITFAPLVDGIVEARLVFSHDAESKKDTVLLRGEGTGGNTMPRFTSNTGRLDFGVVANCTTKIDSIIVTNTGKSNMTISNASSTSGLYTVSPHNAMLPPATSRTFMVAFAPFKADIHTGCLVFAHNGEPNTDTIAVSGSGEGPDCEPIMSLSPRDLNFGTVDTGYAINKMAIISNSGTRDLKLTGWSSTNQWFSVSPSSTTIPPGKSFSMTIRFAPKKPGRHSGIVTFFSDAESSPDSVAVEGVASAATGFPNFTAQPSSLDFGYLEAPDTKSDSVTVTNTGWSALIVAAVSSDNDRFTVTPRQVVIDAGSSSTFAVEFIPEGDAAATGHIFFAHSAPNGMDTVNVSGNTIRPTDILSARNNPDGTEVMVDGIVTRAKGAFARMEDATAGIAIQQSAGSFRKALDEGEIRIGDKIRVRGRLSETNRLRQIASADIIAHERLSRNNPLPMPAFLTLADIPSSGEAYESRLISVIGITIARGGDTQYSAGRAYEIIDASDSTKKVFLHVPGAADTDIDGEPIPDEPVIFTGVLGQYSKSDPAAGYRLLPVLKGDIVTVASGVEHESGLPAGYSLFGNTPNPFASSTVISYFIPERSGIILKIQSTLGSEVATIDEGIRDAGMHRISWDGRDHSGAKLPSGLYFCRIIARPASNSGRTFIAVKKMAIVK